MRTGVTCSVSPNLCGCRKAGGWWVGGRSIGMYVHIHYHSSTLPPRRTRPPQAPTCVRWQGYRSGYMCAAYTTQACGTLGSKRCTAAIIKPWVMSVCIRRPPALSLVQQSSQASYDKRTEIQQRMFHFRRSPHPLFPLSAASWNTWQAALLTDQGRENTSTAPSLLPPTYLRRQCTP